MNGRLKSRKMWMALIAMVLVCAAPFIAGDKAESGSLVNAISMIAMIYLGGQGAVDTVNTYKNGTKAHADGPLEIVGPDPEFLGKEK